MAGKAKRNKLCFGDEGTTESIQSNIINHKVGGGGRGGRETDD